MNLDWKRLILIGLITRLFLSFWTGHPWDFETFIRVGYSIAHGSSLFQLKNYYVPGLGQPIFPYVGGLGYLPAWGLYTALAYRIYQSFPISPFFYYFLLKLAPILGDLAVTYIIFLLTLNYTHDIRKARRNSLMFFLCPFVIFISSVWGMFDSIPVLFTLISILLLLSGKLHWSAFSLGIGIYFKVVPIIYLPIQLFFINKKRGVKETIIYLLISGVVPFVLTLVPVIMFGWGVSEAVVTVFSQTQRTGEVLTYWNLSALLNNLFPNFFSSELLNSFFSFPPIRYLWILGLGAGYLLYYRLQKRLSNESTRTDSLNLLLKGFSLATIGFLLTRTFVPEQFVLYLLPTMVMLSNPVSILRCYKRVWILALVFALVNIYPFAFAYLIKADFWNTFSYLATTQPFSTLRYAARFAIAVFFDCYLIKILLKMVEKP